MRKVKPLSEIKVRNAKAKTANYTLFDGGGLFLLVLKTGTKGWRLKYRYAGKEERLFLGNYPHMSLSNARAKREEIRRLIALGINPKEHEKAQKLAGEEKAANTFEVVAREWFAKKSSECAPGHAEHIKSYLEKDIFPWIGKRPIADINPSLSGNRVRLA